MSQQWLIETLAELQAYAARNAMPALAEHLETAVHLAHLELANARPPPQDPDPDPEG